MRKSGKVNKPRKGKFNVDTTTGFRSKLESNVAAALLKEGILFEYETIKVELAPKGRFCYYNGSKGELKEVCAILAMTYNPDFLSPNNSFDWIIEAKGMATPDYKQKEKLFRHWLATHHPHCKFFVVHNMKELALAIEIIKQITNNNVNSQIRLPN